MSPGRPVHLHWRYLGLVALGGALGTAAREGLTLAVPGIGRFPSTVFAINVAGGFLLGLLLEALVRRGADQGGRRAIRLLVGTGVLGGFTTYSTLATETASLLGARAVALAATYAVATVVVGAGATALGIVVAAAGHRNREARASVTADGGRGRSAGDGPAA